MSSKQQLKDLRDDLQTLLEYSQTLKAENGYLRSCLKGSIVFLRNGDKEKLYRTVAAEGVAFPPLKTVIDGWGHSPTARKPASGVRATADKTTDHPTPNTLTPDSRSPVPNSDGFCNEIHTPAGSRQQQGDTGESVGDMPVVHSISDLADVLLEHNKLQGRLLKYTSNHTVSPPSTTIPSIRDHNLKDVCVVGCREHKNVHEFVIHATWTNGQSFEVYRKYLDFFTFQATLRGLAAWKRRRKLSTITELPLSDHLLAVLDRLNLKRTLQQRAKLVETFCKTVVAEVADRTGGDIYRTSVLIFFASRPGDVEIRSTNREPEFDFPAKEDEVVDECLGFLSSVAEANHTPVHNNFRDVPEPNKAAVNSPIVADFKFNKPSPAHTAVTHTHSAPTTERTADPPTLTTQHAQIAVTSKNTGHMEFRCRSPHTSNNQDDALARLKAISIKSGSTDWGVRVYLPERREQNSRAENGARQLHVV